MSFLDQLPVLIAWIALAAISEAVLVADLGRNNRGLGGTMKVVWMLTVAYSGPIGLLVYWRTGRPTIPDDATWRRSFRSVAHCYSGCGGGEVVGVFIAVGLLSLGNVKEGMHNPREMAEEARAAA